MAGPMETTSLPIAGGRRALPLVVLAAVLAAVVAALWWFDPAEARMPVCALHAATGLSCPGCGATRATHELLHGRLLAALRLNAFWILCLPVVLYSVVSEMRCLWRGRGLPADPARQTWFWWTVAAVALVFFAVRNLPWQPFELLRPPG